MDRVLSERFRKAITLFEANKFEEAIKECQWILNQQPYHLDALQMTGLSLAQLGRKDEAAVPLEMALRISPSLPPLCNNLGELYRQLGRLTDAERLLRYALALVPQFTEAAMNLGNTLKDQERHAEAID